MSRIEVAPAEDFEEGDREIVDVDGTEVGVIRYGGEFYALSNVCLHDGGPVCTGRVHERLEAEHVGAGKPLDWSYSDDQVVVSCPWHGWTYDVETGRHLGKADLVLPTYDVEIDDGTVYVVE